ncbi:MAG: hypothetical protein JSU06_13930 [Actinobacteria bacterium]|nr:hypothetical protein [Actinomycetota bacterium]
MLRRPAFALLALASLLVAVSAVGVASGAAPKKVYVESDVVGQELVYRPHSIGLAADGTFALTGIKYSSYGGPTATATSRAYVRGCTPNCAEGKVYRPTARLRLESLAQCRGKTIYSKLHYTLQGSLPAGFRRQGTEELVPLGPKGC